MENINTLVVDDEAPARERLKRLLKPFSDVRLVGTAADGEEALEQILSLKPDLVFLDVQMPGCSGMEVAASLRSPRPKIVFCTAYDQYAVQAFELSAVDYLLKPVTRARLAEALEWVRRVSVEEAEARISKALGEVDRPAQRFLAKRGSRFYVVPAREVLFFGSEEGLTKLCTAGQSYWIQPTLTDLESQLDSAVFFRISRSAIVNLEKVREVAPLIGGHGQLVLTNKTKLDVSRRRFKALLSQLERT